MSADTKFHVHHDAPEVVGRRERLGVRLLIVADGAFLFGMLFTFFYLKNLNNSGAWLPPDHKKMFSVASAIRSVATTKRSQYVPHVSK